jgi:quinol monooxygenase YgiN
MLLTLTPGVEMPQDAKPLALIVRFTVRRGAEARFDALVAATATGIRDHEPGTLVYACHAMQDKPRQRIFYELYRDRAAFDVHEQAPHTRRFLAERGELLDATDVEFLDLSDGKTPYTEETTRQGAGG